MFSDYLREQLEMPIKIGIDRSKTVSMDKLTKILNDRRIYFSNDGTSTDIQIYNINADRNETKELMDTIYTEIPTVDIMFYGF